MSRLILDHKVICTADAFTIAKFVFDLTNKGYEPLHLQCNRQFGNIVITMVLYEGVNNESTEESTGNKSGAEATDTIGSESGTGESKEQEGIKGNNITVGSEDNITVGNEDSNTGDKPSGTASEVGSKPKRNTRVKAKAE